MPEIQHEILEKTLSERKIVLKKSFQRNALVFLLFSAINYARSSRLYKVCFLLPMKLNKNI